MKTGLDVLTEVAVDEIDGSGGRAVLVTPVFEGLLCVRGTGSMDEKWICLGHVYVKDYVRGGVWRSKDGSVIAVETELESDRREKVDELTFRQGYDFKTGEVLGSWFNGQPARGLEVDRSHERMCTLLSQRGGRIDCRHYHRWFISGRQWGKIHDEIYRRRTTSQFGPLVLSGFDLRPIGKHPRSEESRGRRGAPRRGEVVP